VCEKGLPLSACRGNSSYRNVPSRNGENQLSEGILVRNKEEHTCTNEVNSKQLRALVVDGTSVTAKL
jgi:hypothetical protein